MQAILKCGADISDLKELKDLFVDMVEKVCDHCSAAQLSPEDMNTFFITLAEQCASIMLLSNLVRFDPSWISYARHRDRV